MRMNSPRVVGAGLSGDSGKTLLSLGLVRCLRDRGLDVRTAKKGPDYIDAAWLAAASGAPCVNLDTFMMSREGIGTGAQSLEGADIVLVEGNRGLYDGVDAAGTHSTAELAKLLGAPVLLVVDVTSRPGRWRPRCWAARPRSPAQPRRRDPQPGRNARQEALVRSAVGRSPAAGARRDPRLAGDDPLPGRHLGAVTVAEHPDGGGRSARRRGRGRHVDLDRLSWRSAPAVELPAGARPPTEAASRLPRRSGVLVLPGEPRACAGRAELVPVAPGAEAIARLDGLYIGGGFPEVHAERLADDRSLAGELRAQAAAGLPIYAECGGLMYLARELVVDGSSYPMAGVLDLVIEQTRGRRATPRGRDGRPWQPLLPDRLHPGRPRVHSGRRADAPATVLAVERGRGTGGERDGIVKGSVWASYLHLHSLATPHWAEGFLALASRFAAQRAGTAAAWA
jgi:cobyrinic acid a,c-diamide synthase